jgi:hypothetical protein
MEVWKQREFFYWLFWGGDFGGDFGGDLEMILILILKSFFFVFCLLFFVFGSG